MLRNHFRKHWKKYFVAGFLVGAVYAVKPTVPRISGTPLTVASISGLVHIPGLTYSSKCVSVNGLPDSTCTPGATNSAVTQGTINSTICVSGYTKTIRPPASYTDQLKVQQIALYGYSDTKTADYEEDHFIPLEVGGNPIDPKNLWPEPRYGVHPAADKDKIENLLHQEVCSGSKTLQQAQLEITTNWGVIQ